MRKLITPIASLGLVAVLASCNSTDALIPQVDVGGGTFRSPPVTQSDLESMSTQTAVVPVQSSPVQRTRAFASQPAPASMPTEYATGDSTYTDPAGSLPKWLVGLANTEGIPQLFAAVSTAAKSSRYASLPPPPEMNPLAERPALGECGDTSAPVR